MIGIYLCMFFYCLLVCIFGNSYRSSLVFFLGYIVDYSYCCLGCMGE